jgi:hypothetical protein
MRLLTLPITIVRVPIEFGFGAAKEAVKFAHGLVAGGEEQVEEKPRPAPPPRRRRTSSRSGARSGNGRARSGSRTRKPSRRPAEEAMKAAPPIDEAATVGEAATAESVPPVGETATAESVPPTPVATPPAADEPTHVGEEPELVAETAETGAEDGAGAEVDVGEPWSGYDEMTAPDIEDRLQAEGPEAAAAVSLYEASHKGRASILEAASRVMVS